MIIIYIYIFFLIFKNIISYYIYYQDKFIIQLKYKKKK